MRLTPTLTSFFLRGDEMPKTLFANGLEAGHGKEAFCIVFKFLSSDGNVIDKVHVAISPSGTKTLLNLLGDEMKDYEKEHGKVEPWKTAENQDSNSQKNNAEKYRV